MLKPDRSVFSDDVSFFMNQTAERGGVVCIVTGTYGLGASMDDANNLVGYLPVASVSGRHPVGVLMQDVVNIDQTRQILNPYKSEVQVGNKVVVVRKGWVTTNMLTTGSATGTVFPITAYLAGDGKVIADGTNYQTASGYREVGRVMGRVDSDGYAKLYVDL